jgi:hypothetical protein
MSEVITYRGFYLSETDISSRIDFDVKAEIKEMQQEQQFFEMKYRESNQATSEFLNEGTDLKMGASRFEFQNYAEQNEVLESENPSFEQVLMCKDINLYRSDFTPEQLAPMPLSYPQNALPTDVGGDGDNAGPKYESRALLLYFIPRLPYFSTATTSYAQANRVAFAGDTTATRYTMPMSISVLHDNTADFSNALHEDVNLNYCDVTDVFNEDIAGLMKLFYMRDMATRDRGEILQLNLLFKALDLLSYNTQYSKYSWQELNWYLLEIKAFNFVEQVSTEIKMQKICYADADDIARVTASEVPTFVDLNAR